MTPVTNGASTTRYIVIDLLLGSPVLHPPAHLAPRRREPGRAGHWPGGNRKMAICGFSAEENAAPPGTANRIDTVAAFAGVSSRK